MKTAVVILNWNGRHFLKKYLPSVLQSVRDMDAEVIVADNASTDGSVDFMRETYPDTRVIELKHNLGFAEGYNRALKQVEAEYYLLLNSDVQVPQGWLDTLVEWMDLHEDCGICGPKIHQMEKRDCFEYAGAAGGYIDIMGYPFCRGRVMQSVETDCGQYDSAPSEVFWVSGAALMIRSTLFHSLKGFASEFFAHMEEIDLCWRARLKGYKVCLVPRSTIYHVGGGSLPKESPRKLQLNYRNNLLMLRRNLPSTLALCTAFSILSKVAERDEGPDYLEVCRSVVDEQESGFRTELSRTCADAGLQMAGTIIKLRMWLDRLSALCYLFSGKKESYKAVRKAHREYLLMQDGPGTPGRKAIIRLLNEVLSGERMDIAHIMLTSETDNENAGRKAIKIKGIWKKLMIFRYLSQKNDIFNEVKDNII